MTAIEQKLEALGFQLAPAKPPVGNYLGCKRVGNLLFASGRVSELRGAVGSDVTVPQAYEAARDTVLLILAILREDGVELDRLAGVAKVTGFIRSAPGFTAQPAVLDGASDLLVQLFGDAGRHARTATGVAELPFGASVQLDIIFEWAER